MGGASTPRDQIDYSNSQDHELMQLPQLSFQELFNIYDRDKDSWITKKEVETVMQALDEELYDDDIDAMTFGIQSLVFQIHFDRS